MRLGPLTELSPEQAELSARITARRGGTRGPFLVWLRSPGLADKVEALGAYCRFESSLPPPSERTYTGSRSSPRTSPPSSTSPKSVTQQPEDDRKAPPINKPAG